MNTAEHYDRLIEENNDPFLDPPALQAYMNLWDGPVFLEQLQLHPHKNVLEIGIGTGRIAAQVAPHCSHLTGIDISPKTIERAAKNLQPHPNITLICDDFLTHTFAHTYDIIYSSLTMMHFENKNDVIAKVDALLGSDGIFCLSIDKHQSSYIDMGAWQLRIYPDTLANILALIRPSAMQTKKTIETEFAHIIVCSKQSRQTI